VFRHGFPVAPRQVGILRQIASGHPLDQIGAGVMEGGQGEEFAGAFGQGRFLHVHDISEHFGLGDHQPGQLGLSMAVVVQQSLRPARPDSMAVQVSEHLLGVFQPDVGKKS
jgi:hypothetical protein